MLKGIRVVELGTYMAVPAAARLLADWGAEVIKVEPPGGEAWRTIGNSYGVPYSESCNPLFEVPNANKRAIALNLRSKEGLAVLGKLLEHADVFLTNARRRALVKMGLDYETLKERFPRLVYAHFTGYGAVGPDKDLPGYDIAAYWAKAGMPLEWSLREAGPFRPLPGFGDTTVATVILSGVLAALLGRSQTGKGDLVETSLYSSALWFNNCGVLSAQYKQEDYPLSTYEQPSPYHVIYRTKDNGYIMFSAPKWDEMHDKLFEEMHIPQYVGDPRFATIDLTRKNLKAMVDILRDAFSAMTTQEVRDMFIRLDVVCQVVVNPKDVLRDEQAWVNHYLRKVTLRSGDEVTIPAPPVHFLNSQTRGQELAPRLGEHTAEILTELGYGREAVQSLLQSGAAVARKSTE